jgi:hypothetical protein
MTEREEWLLSMYDHIRNVEGSKRPPGFPPNESEYMEAVELDRARRQAAERMKYGTIEQGPTGFMANYITPMIDSLEQPRMGGPDGVSTADLLGLGMLGRGIGGAAGKARNPLTRFEPGRSRTYTEYVPPKQGQFQRGQLRGEREIPAGYRMGKARKATEQISPDKNVRLTREGETLPAKRGYGVRPEVRETQGPGRPGRTLQGEEYEKLTALEQLMMGLGKYFSPGK